MFSSSIIRYIICCVLIIHSSAIEQNKGSANKIDSKDQHAKKGNVFNILNRFYNRGSKSIDRTFIPETIKEKENVQNRKSDQMNKQPCLSVDKYQTIIDSYRSIAKSWIDQLQLVSKDVKQYSLTIDFSPKELSRLKQFASSSDYDQKKVLDDVRDISYYLKNNAYVCKETKFSYIDLPSSTFMSSYHINSISQVALSITVLAITISVFYFHIPVYSVRGFVVLFIIWFIVSVYQNWHTLYREELAKISHILAKGLPKGCDTHSVGIINRVINYFRGFVEVPDERCLDFHRALHAAPHTKATIVQAVSITVAQIFVTPLGLIGESLSMFFAGTMRYVPKLAWPIVITIILCFISMIIFVCAGDRLRPLIALLPLVQNNNPRQRLTQVQNDNHRLTNENQ